MIFVLAAMIENGVQLQGIESGSVEGATSGFGGHRRDRVLRPGDVNLADAHLLQHDEIGQARARGDLLAGEDLRRDVNPRPGHADGGQCWKGHAAVPKGDSKTTL